MTIDQIESFVAVASSGSISQAAARLFRSQPNLSYSLKQLEAELGYPLLVRTNQGVTLTSGGREFLSYAQDALRAFHQLRNFSIVRTAENESTLRVAAMPFCGVSEAVEMLLAELDQPPTQILLNPCMRDGMIAGLNSRQYDVGYAYAYSGAVQSFMTQLDVNGLEAQPLCKCRPCALIGPGSPWFSSPPEKLSVQQLNSVRRVFFTKSGAQSFSSTQFRDLTGGAGTVLAGDQQDIRMILSAIPSFSLAPCSEALLEQGGTVMKGLKCVPIEGRDQTGEYYAVYRKELPSAGLSRRLTELLLERLTGATA